MQERNLKETAVGEGSHLVPVSRCDSKGIQVGEDAITVEEPLEIRVGGKSFSVTMRTPGHDLDLVTGFLFTEGAVKAGAMPSLKRTGRNVVSVEIKGAVSKSLRRLQSRFFVSSSCGLCGRTSVASVRRRLGAIRSDATVPASVLCALPSKMRESQETFGATGGLHAAALFDRDGAILMVREDVGRHNAVDKVIGNWIRSDDGRVPVGLLVSGRASFEIVQKALAAKIPIVAAVSAPSSLAVELAREAGMTLVGFLRGERFNIYTRSDRVKGAS